MTSTVLAARLPAHNDRAVKGSSPTGTPSRPASRRQGSPTGSDLPDQERADRRRFPVQPALDAIDRAGVCRIVVIRAGVNLNRAVRIGTLNGDQADRLAVAIGRHPYDIWGDDWYRETEQP